MATVMNDRRAPLSEIVADTLRQSLKDGVYLCGERLAESVIAREMNVSQNTARDALSILEKEGWIVKQARRGMTIREFSVDEVRELYMLRATLEKLALGWAMDSITEHNQMMLARTISDARLQAGMANMAGLHESIFNFHEYILQMIVKPQTASIIQMLINQCRLLENIRMMHAPHDENTYAHIISSYGDLLTRIRYHERKAALNTLHDMIMEEGRSLLPIVDLVM